MKKNYDLIQLNYGFLNVEEYLDMQKFINNGVVGIGEVTERVLEDNLVNILRHELTNNATKRFFNLKAIPPQDYLEYLAEQIRKRDGS